MSNRQEKRDQFAVKTAKASRTPLIWAALILTVTAVGAWFTLQGQALGHAEVSAQADGTLRFAAADLADGEARFYRYQGQSGPIDFFLVQSHDGVVRAAFDSCDVCYRERLGYRQEGADMVCNNCDQHFRTDLVNVVKGGCNPAPLARKKVGDEIVIRVADLQPGIRYFSSN